MKRLEKCKTNTLVIVAISGLFLNACAGNVQRVTPPTNGKAVHLVENNPNKDFIEAART